MSALQALQAEANRPADGVLVTLTTAKGAADLTVPDPTEWPTRALSYLRATDAEAWAEIVLSPEDYKAWAELDPRLKDAQVFFAEWEIASGESRGKSSASLRS